MSSFVAGNVSSAAHLNQRPRAFPVALAALALPISIAAGVASILTLNYFNLQTSWIIGLLPMLLVYIALLIVATKEARVQHPFGMIVASIFMVIGGMFGEGLFGAFVILGAAPWFYLLLLLVGVPLLIWASVAAARRRVEFEQQLANGSADA